MCFCPIGNRFTLAMLLVFVCFARSLVRGRSPNQDDKFVVRVVDGNWTEVSKQYRDFFLFFHADHNRMADIAYLRYVKVARKYKDQATFAAVVGQYGDYIARGFRIPGYPCLYRVMNTNQSIEMLGTLSEAGIERFVENFTRPGYERIAKERLDGVASVEQLVSIAKVDDYDETTLIFLLCDNSTRFGRVAEKLARELPNDYRIFMIEDPAGAKIFQTRFPSIALVNQEDGAVKFYDGDPVLETMVEWVKANSAPLVNSFSIAKMFDPDGLSRRTVLNFAARSELSALKKGLLAEASKNDKVSYSYADPMEQTKLLRLLGYDSGVRRVCLVANYTFIGHAECESGKDLEANSVALKWIPTPREAYGYIAKVNENAFNDFLKDGPVFVAFDLKDCYRCHEAADAASEAARAVAKFNSTARWCVWDVYKAVPTFREQLNLQVPSVWYFNSTDPSTAVQYNGKPDFLDIIQWANKVHNDFSLIRLLEHFTNTEQFDSL